MFIDKFRKTGTWVDDDDTYYGDIKDTSVEEVIMCYYFGADGTIEADKFLSYIFKFLNIIVENKPQQEFTGEFYAMMAFLEKCDLIELGVSIRYPWFTEQGKNLYNDLKELYQKEKQ